MRRSRVTVPLEMAKESEKCRGLWVERRVGMDF